MLFGSCGFQDAQSDTLTVMVRGLAEDGHGLLVRGDGLAEPVRFLQREARLFGASP